MDEAENLDPERKSLFRCVWLSCPATIRETLMHLDLLVLAGNTTATGKHESHRSANQDGFALMYEKAFPLLDAKMRSALRVAIAALGWKGRGNADQHFMDQFSSVNVDV
jgi:hypothetical protein